MSINCKVLKGGKCEVSQIYKGTNHTGIDLVGSGYTLDNVIAHSKGTVVGLVNNINYNTSKTSERIYGNYVKIKHDNGMYTLYAHLKYNTINVKLNQTVEAGTILGYMGNTGYSFGSHLHFEVRNSNNVAIDPTEYVSKNLPEIPIYKVGNVYKLNVILHVRTGAGIKNAAVPYEKLTQNGKEHAYSTGVNKGCLKSGTKVTLLEIKNVGNEIWGRIPSGWIAFKYNGKVYVE